MLITLHYMIETWPKGLKKRSCILVSKEGVVGENTTPELFQDHQLKGLLYIYPPTRNTKIQFYNITLYYTIEMYKRYFTSKWVAHITLCMRLLHSHIPLYRRPSLTQ
ncbi:unnamed protein product [Cuscuta epithymum]|uniref:Uncharacterized protein n=1 Tax=Cuscuta epithymum TaxID=186058 RepID=A0AAV0ES57_9ASTE|nr:unnamed protein product [Cuscuta epithymum]